MRHRVKGIPFPDRPVPNERLKELAYDNLVKSICDGHLTVEDAIRRLLEKLSVARLAAAVPGRFFFSRLPRMSMDHRNAVSSNASERYLLGEMSEPERFAFEAHYFDCLECAADVRAGAVLARGV
jgi:hypothetical protein